MGELFNLSQGEKQLLLGANVGQGIFFAGNNHAPISVVASPEEHKLVTTKPSEILEQTRPQTQLPEQAAPGMVAQVTQRME